MTNKQKPVVELLTIGHSSRELRDFLNLLQEFHVNRVVDVRKMTRSRAHPQFNEASLPDALAEEGISYEHLASLGGLRSRTSGASAELNGNWRNASFHRYADYALTESFRQGLGHLMEEGSKQRCAIMCAEAVWWRCHRRIISDYLIAHGCHVQHILGAGRLDAAQLTPGAVICADMSVVYPTSNSGDVKVGDKP